MALASLVRRRVAGIPCRPPRSRRPIQGVATRASRGFSAQPQPAQEEDSAPFSPPLHSPRRNDGILSFRKAHRHAERPQPEIGRLVLVRHGQSEWNVTDPTRNLTARFTGWADIGLTQQGRDQAVAAGKAIQLAADKHILPARDIADDVNVPAIDVVFCSLLKRSTDTMNIILDEIGLAERMPSGEEKDTTKDSPKYQYPIPVIHSWRLNERHYGALVGLSKEGAERLYGKQRLTRWRDSWDIPPPPMPIEMVKRWGSEEHCQPVTIVKKGVSGRTCVFDPAAANLQNKKIVEHGGRRRNAIVTTEDGLEDDSATFMPPSESLGDTYERFLPLFIQGIAPHLRAGRTVLVVGHANTIRSIVFAIDGDVVTKQNAKQVKIPSALPLVYEFVDRDGSGCLELDEKDHQEASVNGWRTHKYKVGGRECSNLVPGNLRVLRPQSDTTVDASKKSDMRYKLSGVWVETELTKSVSFCTELGREMGEQDIA